VEGPIDAIAVTLAGNGRYAGVAPLGTALTDTQADHLRPYLGPGKPGAIVGTDADTAGNTAAERAYWLLTTRGDRPDRLTLPEGLDPADLLHQSGPSTLLDALDHPTDLASLLIDRRVDAYTDILRFAERRIAAARAVAPVIAALPIQAWPPIIENLAARLHLPAVTVGLIVFDAGQAQETSPLTTARQHSPAPPEPTTPASRNLPPTPSHQASSTTRRHRTASTSTTANHAAPPPSPSSRPTPPRPPHHR
jgi:DNA primase